ncbi:MAG TPA: copper-binding protein [Ramlibacter sp.]|jgi:Cu/Ag efflux protein CusF
MNAFKLSLLAGAIGMAGAFTLPAQAQTAAAGAAAAATASDMADAEVRKVDKENRKITLKHGAIKNLDMPPMTMVFQVADASMLDKLQPGDKIRFRATSDAGKMTVIEIQPVK